MEIYVVQPGDDINMIAEKFGTSVSRLIQDNGLENPYDLVIGQTVIIAYPNQIHTVQEGDSLKSIADAYGVTVMQILRNNPYLIGREYIYPGETIVISYPTNQKIVINGFMYPYINRDTLLKTLPNLTYLSVLNYRTTGEGDVIAYYDDTETIQLAKAYGVIPLLMTTSLTPQGEPNLEAAFRILQDEESRENFINSTLNIMKSKGYYGVNIIFNFMNTENQKIYLNFLAILSPRFINEGFLLLITINYSIKNINNEMTFERVDYSSMSNYVNDFIFLQLTWGSNYGPPLPIISVDNLGIFLDYLLTLITPDKLILGAPLLSYDWELPYIPGKTAAHSLSLSSALSLAQDYEVPIQFDEVSQSTYFLYNQSNLAIPIEHIVWAIDPRTIDSINKMVSTKELEGTGFWNIMIYYPQIWLLYISQYEIQKLIPDSIV